MKLFNTKTREREDIDDPEALQNALLSGTHSYAAGVQVSGVDPDGKPVNIPAESVADAISRGYKVNTSSQNAVEKYVSENKGVGGAAKVFLSQAVDEAAMGIPEMIYESKGDPLEVAKREALKKEHELANAAGGAAGFAGSLFVGGPLWKAGAKAGEKTAAVLAEKILAKSAGQVSERAAKRVARDFLAKSAAKSAGGAVEGAIVSSPIAITEAMLGDPEAAAESLLAGVGIGGLFGGAGAMGSQFKSMAKDTAIVRKLRSKVDDTLRTGDGLDKRLADAANEKYFEALDPKKHHLKRVSANEELEDEFGNAISLVSSRDTKKIGATLREEGIMEGLPDIGEIAGRIQTRSRELADDVAQTFKRLDDTYGQNALVDLDEVVSSIEKNVLPKLQKNKAIHAEISRFKKELEILKSPKPAFSPDEINAIDFGDLSGLVDGLPHTPGNKLSLAEANTLKGDYQRKIGDTAITESKTFKDLLNEVPKEINRQIRSKIGSIDKAELDQLIRTQKKLGNLRAAEKIAVDRAEASVSNNDMGLTSFISGVGGAAMFDGGMSLIAGLGAGLGREFTRRHGDLLIAKSYDKVGGLLFAEQAMKRTAQKIDEVPKLLKRMSSGASETLSVSKRASIPIIARLLGEESPKAQIRAEGGSKPEKPHPYKRLNKNLEQLVSNPDSMIDRLSELTEPFSQSGAPLIGAAFSSQISRAVSYLHESIPKPPRLNSPFAPQIEWEPGSHEVAVFEEKLAVVMDPFLVFDELEAGSLTINHMEALQTVYPAIYESMRTKVTETVVNGVDPVSYEKRVKLSLLMDAPMDPSLEPGAMSFYQSSFAQIEAEDAAEEAKRQSFSAKVDMAESSMTPSQKLLGRG